MTKSSRGGRWPLALHDLVSRGAFGLACTALAIIVASFAYEVVMRYAFNAPTLWASDLVSFLLLASVFFAAPWLTRDGGHIAITLLPDMLPRRGANLVLRAGFLVSAAVCAWTGWIVAEEVAILVSRGTRTLSGVSIPKWWLVALILFGFVGSSLYFVRLAFGPMATDGTGAVSDA